MREYYTFSELPVTAHGLLPVHPLFMPGNQRAGKRNGSQQLKAISCPLTGINKRSGYILHYSKGINTLAGGLTVRSEKAKHNSND